MGLFVSIIRSYNRTFRTPEHRAKSWFTSNQGLVKIHRKTADPAVIENISCRLLSGRVTLQSAAAKFPKEILARVMDIWGIESPQITNIISVSLEDVAAASTNTAVLRQLSFHPLTRKIAASNPHLPAEDVARVIAKIPKEEVFDQRISNGNFAMSFYHSEYGNPADALKCTRSEYNYVSAIAAEEILSKHSPEKRVLILSLLKKINPELHRVIR